MRRTSQQKTTTLWRPTGPKELDLVQKLNWRAWPPRLPLRRYPVQQAGGQTILELWVPAEELDDFNTHIIGEIQVVHEFR
ncbi:hypothetical protein [Streptomyces sp. NPDC051994]|uniref:hypothetical protein n=1 Tax=unclassified Streptomyces TaxID=2593676 RepID=UPI00341DA26C